MLQLKYHKSKERKMKVFKLIISLLCACLFVIGCAKKTAPSIDNTTSHSPKPRPVSQNAPVSQSPQSPPTLQSPLQGIQKSIIIAKNGDTFDANNYANTLYHIIIFDNSVLMGGIFDDKQGIYKSPDREISYTLVGETLTIKDIARNTQFTIKHFSQGDFNIYLSNNPTKEVAIVLNTNKSMSAYINALKDIAQFVGNHILGEREKQFAKISLETFTYIRLSDLGTFYDAEDFANALNGVSVNRLASSDNMVNLALIMGMRNFTNANGLKKEVFLITNGASDDPQNLERVLFSAKNLKAQLDSRDKDNLLKIHIFAIKPFNSRKSASENIRLLKNLANATGGTYNEIENVVELKEKVLLFSNDGKAFDKKEIGNEIRIIETQKIDDPDK